jgi:AraC-like DNA-binding protein
VSRRLGVSVRTLQRAAEAAGTTVGALRAEQQARTARELVERSALTLDEIAVRIGYSDAQTFARALKKWTGTTPASHRRSRPS